MGTPEPTITLFGLSRADKLDIAAVDPNSQVTFASIDNIGDRHGEPVTIAAVLTMSALGVLATWIVKTRRRSVVEFELDVRAADGSSRHAVFKKEVTSETSEAEVLKALAQVTQVAI